MRLFRRYTLPLLAALALAVFGGGARAADLSYTLLRGVPPAGGPSILYAATLHPEAVAPAAWDDRLAKIRRGGFNAVHVALPADFGPEGALTPAALEDLLGRIARSGLQVVVGPPTGPAPADWAARLEAAKPVLAKQAAGILWIQPKGGAPAALAGLAPGGKPLMVVEVAAGTVPNAADEQRPFRQPAVAVALREAAASGAGVLAWDSPFAGVAAPLMTAAKQAGVSKPEGPEAGVLPIAYYEGRLFSQVARVLGDVLAKAQPVAGAGSDVPAIQVSQRGAGEQGLLYVRAPEELQRGFHFTFTDPATKEKLTVPKTPGLGLRTFGAGARLLPLNLQIPGAVIRYSTAEVFGVYRSGARTLICVTDDEGAPNELALKLDATEAPKCSDMPAQPIWDATTKTLTIGFVPAFADAFFTIGNNLVLAVIPTERAQRTWSVPWAGDEVPVVTSAYLAEEPRDVNGNLVLYVLAQQGKADVTFVMAKWPKYTAVNQQGPRVRADPLSAAYSFVLDTPPLVDLKLSVPAVQVLRRARFQATGARSGDRPQPVPGDRPQPDFARPDLPPDGWSEVNLDKPRGAGRYRVSFRLPKVPGWQVPWRAAVQLRGEAAIYLNGTLVGKASGAGEKGGFVEVSLPEALLTPAGDENLLAISLGGDGAALMKVGITPWMEHAVCRHEIIFFK